VFSCELLDVSEQGELKDNNKIFLQAKSVEKCLQKIEKLSAFFLDMGISKTPETKNAHTKKRSSEKVPTYLPTHLPNVTFFPGAALDAIKSFLQHIHEIYVENLLPFTFTGPYKLQHTNKNRQRQKIQCPMSDFSFYSSLILLFCCVFVLG
jgi:hypothetical protein